MSIGTDEQQMKVQKIEKMLDMQDKLNTLTKGEDWHELNLKWCRAMWVEAGELMDVVGYKWWKHQIFQREKVHGEIVDILHFLLSYSMENAPVTEPTAIIIAGLLERPTVLSDEPAEAVERFVAKVFQYRGSMRIAPLWQAFSAVLVACDLSFDELYAKYIGKNVLNEFRQKNGYATGEGVLNYYSKVWSDGREDNEHLVDIMMRHVDIDSPTLEADIFLHLENRYILGDD